MHNASSLWKRIFRELNHVKEIMVKVNGVEYHEDRILYTPPSVSGKLFDAPSVGNARSRTLTLNLMPYAAPQGRVPPMSEIRLYVRLKSADGQLVSEWIPKGVFYADEVKRAPETGMLTISAFDAMMKMERQFGNAVVRIVFNDGFGGIQRFVREIGDAMPTPDTPAHDGQRFLAWYPNPADTPTLMRDMLFTANWEEAMTPSSVAITAYPAKMTYACNEPLDYTGLVVTATYSDNTRRDVTADCLVSPVAGTEIAQAGTVTVTVSYDGATVGTFDVTVGVIASGDWWTLYDSGLLDIYRGGNMPNYSPSSPPPWEPYNSSITEVAVSANTYSVGDYAFAGCVNLSSVTFATKIIEHAYDVGTSWFLEEGVESTHLIIGVEAIGRYAFYECVRLKNITIPASVEEIFDYAFAGCANLSGLTFANEILPSVTEFTDYNYGLPKDDDDYTLPVHGVLTEDIAFGAERIYEYAFYECAGLESITFPASVHYIDSYAFAECSGLSNAAFLTGSLHGVIEYEDAMHRRGSIPFSRYEYGIGKIKRNAFSECASLSDIYYDGTEAEWAERYIESNALPPNVIIHYNSSGPS